MSIRTQSKLNGKNVQYPPPTDHMVCLIYPAVVEVVTPAAVTFRGSSLQLLPLSEHLLVLKEEASPETFPFSLGERENCSLSLPSNCYHLAGRNRGMQGNAELEALPPN